MLAESEHVHSPQFLMKVFPKGPGIDAEDVLRTVQKTYHLHTCFDVGTCDGGSTSIDAPSARLLKDVLLFFDSTPWRAAELARGDKITVTTQEARKALRKGYTAQITAIHYRNRFVADFAKKLEQMTGMFVSVNAYLSPTKNATVKGFGRSVQSDGSLSALPAHYDPWGVWVAQLQGSKKWTLYSPLNPTPHPHQVSKVSDLLTDCGVMKYGHGLSPDEAGTCPNGAPPKETAAQTSPRDHPERGRYPVRSSGSDSPCGADPDILVTSGCGYACDGP